MNDNRERASDDPADAPPPETAPRPRDVNEPAGPDDRRPDVEGATAQFAANLSRDLRTPLLLLLGPLQDILESPAAGFGSQSRTALETARQNALRLLALLDVLPDPLRKDRGRDGADGELFDLAGLTAALAATFGPSCAAAGLQLAVDCPPLSEPVDVDRNAWEAIVLNLIAHAFKSTAEGTITVRVRAHDGNAQLIVSDTGPGMAESELPYVFGPGGGAAPARAGRSQPSGFGLAFVHHLVHLQNGSIDVRNTPGRGCSFTVVLPTGAGRLSGDPVAASPRSRDTPGPDVCVRAADGAVRSRGQVVIAEDHAETRDYLSHVLETAGFTVVALADGAAALAACQARAPEALVSDVLMPGLDGFALIARLRADERTAVIPVLLLSARGGEESRIEGIAAGADDYLVKPLSRRELVARVDGAVRLGRLRREQARREQADLEALFSLAPDGLMVVGHDGRILAANDQARQLFGYATEELVALPVEALVPVSDRHAHVSHREAYAQAPVARVMNPVQSFRGRRKDGSEFSAEIWLGPIQFKNQPCTMAVVRNIDARKQLEAERAEQERRFRELSGRLLDVQEAERRELSTELHDRTSPQLAAIQINLNLLNRVLSTRETEDVRALLEDTAALVAETTVGIREISSDLRPAVLDDGGLLPALAAYAQQFRQRTGIVVHLHTEDATTTLPPATQSSLFRIVQEALTNCAKHARAANVTIRLSTGSSPLLSLTVADDGIGFDLTRQNASGLGLLTMRERTEFLGGRFTLETAPGEGTRIHVLV